MMFGICNGFQILLEAGVVAGRGDAEFGAALHLPACACAVSRRTRPFDECCEEGADYHGFRSRTTMGIINVDESTLAELEKNRQVIFRYTECGWLG